MLWWWCFVMLIHHANTAVWQWCMYYDMRNSFILFTHCIIIIIPYWPKLEPLEGKSCIVKVSVGPTLSVCRCVGGLKANTVVQVEAISCCKSLGPVAHQCQYCQPWEWLHKYQLTMEGSDNQRFTPRAYVIQYSGS